MQDFPPSGFDRRTLTVIEAAAPRELKPAERVIRIASDTELRRKHHQQRLAIAVRALGVSRRELLDLLADFIYGFEGTILWPNGGVFDVTDTLIDDAFADADGRWISDFLGFAEEAPRQRAQQRVVPRLRLLDLYFRIKHPERARLIAE